MKNTVEKHNEKIVITALPLTDEQLDKYYEDIKEYKFFVDLDITELNPRSFLNYVYNSGMDCDIKLKEVTPENTEKLNALLIEYVKTDKIVCIDLISELWGSICLHVMYPTLESPSKEVNTFVAQFIEKHGDIAKEVATAIASLYYWLIEKMNSKDISSYPQKSLPESIGANIVSLRHAGNFWSFYMNIKDYKGDIFNYKDFSMFKYDGYNAAQFFLCKPGPFISIASMNNEANINEH